MVDCTACDALAMSWLAETIVSAVFCKWPNRSDWFGDAACDLLDVAGDIGKLHAEAADAVGKLVDQSFGSVWLD